MNLGQPTSDKIASSRFSINFFPCVETCTLGLNFIRPPPNIGSAISSSPRPRLLPMPAFEPPATVCKSPKADSFQTVFSNGDGIEKTLPINVDVTRYSLLVSFDSHVSTSQMIFELGFFVFDSPSASFLISFIISFFPSFRGRPNILIQVLVYHQFSVTQPDAVDHHGRCSAFLSHSSPL